MLSGISWFIRLSGVSRFSVFVWWLVVLCFVGRGVTSHLFVTQIPVLACFVLCVVFLLCDLVLGLIVIYL